MSATGARLLAGFRCEILVDRQKERPEPGGPRQIMIHGRVLRSCDKPRSTPLGKLDPVIRLFEGNFLGCLSDLAQESRISRRLGWPRSFWLADTALPQRRDQVNLDWRMSKIFLPLTPPAIRGGGFLIESLALFLF